MSVNLQGLTKKFGEQIAVNNLNFTVEKGHIIGFLGPNGAGKSTTMKMLTCYTEPTSGSATVDGYDIMKSPLDVRKSVGYLPEHNPLYKDMYVKEYLSFVAGIHKVSNAKNRISELIEMTGLGIEQHKLIGALSKGYRQRVGLAQAMMHDPEVLILDEPTSGLDPNQLRDIRSLILELGKEKTVIFSTHIMQEVSALCDRVLIIDRGNLVADDPIETLQARVNSEQQIAVVFDSAIPHDKLKTIDGFKSFVNKGNEYTIIATKDIRKELFHWAVAQKVVIIEMNAIKLSIENVFTELTQQGKNV